MPMIFKFIFTQVNLTWLNLKTCYNVQDISSIYAWSNSNHLITNPGKTQFIIFGPELEVNDLYRNNFSLNPDMHHLPLSPLVKNLGINIDKDLSWDSYINKLSKSINFTLYRLRYFQNMTNLELRKKLGVALVFPHFDDCSPALGNLSEYQYDLLQKLLNSCVRYACRLG